MDYEILKDVKNNLVWTLVMGVLFIWANISFIEAHETAHAQICEKFGLNVTSFRASVFEGEVMCYGQLNDFHTLAQSNVEGFGYQLRVLINVIIICTYIFGCLVLSLEARRYA